MPALMPRDRVIYRGDVSVPLLTAQVTVTFPADMPGAYDVYFKQPTGGLSITSIGNVTPSGFTINLSVNLAGSLTWVAVEQR